MAMQNSATVATTLSEQDEAGNILRTYIFSSSSGEQQQQGTSAIDKKDEGSSQEKGSTRVDVVTPKQARKTILQQLLDVFLPSGFPNSVTEDYVAYQIFDSLQAFSSSIAGMLASRAVLEGVGVGDPTTTPTAALLLSVLHESTGRIATILFAHRLGTALEPECKMYRLAADIFNDTAMVLDCLSPGFPKPLRVVVLSGASCLRALCGVCAGSAKASLSAHFAKAGNLGEVNAKDSSQETVISLLGMLAGSFAVSHITSPLETWCTFILLLCIHLGTNYAAVRAVKMQSLNRQRANILFGHVFQHGVVLSPGEVSTRERIFERSGVLRWANDEVLGRCRIGVSLHDMLGAIGARQHKLSGSLLASPHSGVDVFELLSVFKSEGYVLWPAPPAGEALIVLKAGCGPIDQLKAWAHVLLVAARAQHGKEYSESKPDMAAAPAMTAAAEATTTTTIDKHGLIAELRETLIEVQTMFDKYGETMRTKGWDLSVAAMETKAGMRLQIS
ncbi:uncharacterized protein yc1106_03790 [Curvularia clavata]|uniref:Protein root UVB sensitive/RUS domain-containing protein n=1 Tax=Curvularia clavata TaxID=95742 RepID=A0A9Q8Z642_CURCL|nr:uncharacterized protein yc1106_03790 [Curvularia clavata]